MIGGENRISINSMQQMRIEEHPIRTDGSLLVFDNLEVGSLKFYELLDGPVMLQQILNYDKDVRNAVLVAEAIINSSWRKEGVFIHKVFFEYGYESLIQPMLDQIIHFANFYVCYQSVGMAELEYDKCLPYAKEILAEFQKINRVYEYQINR